MSQRREHEREGQWGAPPESDGPPSPGKLTWSGLFPEPSVRTPVAGRVAPERRDEPVVGPWEGTSVLQALGTAPNDARWREDAGPASTLTVGQGEAAGAASNHATAGGPVLAAVPLDFSADVRGAAAPSATMHVRALDASGALLQEWLGAAYVAGALPVSYQGERTPQGWRWTQDGVPSSAGAKLKLDSDARGQAGRTLAEWAPGAAHAITCDLVARTAPAGADADPLPGDAATRIVRSPNGAREADGNTPISDRLGAVLALEGPEQPGTSRVHGGMVVQDEARGTTIYLGAQGTSRVRLYGSPAEYVYRIAPQTSPRQRVVQITATYDVGLETYLDPASPIELVPQVRRVPRPELEALRAADSEGGPGILRVRRPEIVATGDSWRTELRLGVSTITMTALGDGARFAYWVDPDWQGTARVVYVVATPGVRIDQGAAPGGARDDDPRKLVVQRLYVQDPRRVPQQGEPIDPSGFVGVERHDNTSPEISPHPRNHSAFQVATGGTGITIRDLHSGAALRVFSADPTLGARFLHEVDGKQVRVLVGQGARVEIEQARIVPIVPTEKADPFFDFGQVDFQIYQAEGDRFPPPGTPLTPETLSAYGHPRGPDRVAWVMPQKSADQISIEALFDGGMGFAPGVGDLLDFADAAAVVTMGTDKWGNPLAFGEKVAVVVAALLPLATAGVFLLGPRLLKAASALAPLAKLASKLGRTEEELQALLSCVRKLDDEGRLAVRRVERAIELGDEVAAADLLRLEQSLGRAGLRAAGVATPAAARFGSAAATGVAGASGAPLARTPQLLERERELGLALRRHTRTLGVRGASARASVQVIPKAHFVQRFGSEQARAVCQITERGPVIVARVDATAHDLLDEAAHLAQLADPAMAPALRYLDERNLGDWASLSVPDRLGFYETKLDLEIDAKRRALRVVRDEPERRIAQGALEDLERRAAELAALDPSDVARMASGEMPPPQFLDEPPRLFGKERRVIEEIPSPKGSANLSEPGRVVDSTKGSADYSGAYAMDGVSEVRQRGNSWYEIDYVTSDLQGLIVSRTVDADGATHLVVERGGVRRDHVFEPNAQIDPAMKPGRKVVHGERLGKDAAREYRRVELTFADGAKHERTEIRSQRDGRGWVQRGQESTARGTAAEARARIAADLDLEARRAKGEISSYFHIPHRVGGGGFDDVIVEFAGEGEAMQVKVRIREVKDYANRYVSPSDLSAIAKNIDTNLEELTRSAESVEQAIAKGRHVDSSLKDMTREQSSAIVSALERGAFHVELVISSSTRVRTDLGHPPGRFKGATFQIFRDGGRR